MTIEVIIMGALIIGSFWWEGRIKAERKAKKEADNAAPPNATTAKQAPIAKDNPTAERKPVAASTKIPQSAPAPKPTKAAKPAVAVKPAPTIERAAAATQTPPAKSKPASEPESTAKQALHHQRKDGQSGKSQVPHTDFTLAVQDERTFRNKYILDEKHGYGQKSLWLNYLSLGYVEGNIPAVKYDVIWRASASMGDGGCAVDRVPPNICRSGNISEFINWLHSVLPEFNPEDRERYLHNENLHKYIREIREQTERAENEGEVYRTWLEGAENINSAIPGKVLIKSAKLSNENVSTVELYSNYTNNEARIILFSVPQVIEIKNVSRFCDNMRAKGATVYARNEWPGTAGEWADMEKRFPPFRIGKFEVYLDSWNKSVRISVASWRGGGASFNLQDCSLDLSYGTDRMNAGGFTLHFDKKKRITAGDVLLEASSFVKSRGDVWLTPEACVDDTIIWPISPFADVAMRGEAMPGEAMPGPASSKSTTSKHADGRSEAAIRRDAAARQELAARLEAEAKNELMVKLLPFLENHASDESWDKCAEEILRYYYELKEGDFYDAIKYKHWNVTADCIESVDTWESHSFFDDGGGVSGYVRKSIAYVVSEADKGSASETDNRGTSGAGEKKTIDSSAHRYTPGGAPIHKSRYERDPYGLKGLFRLSYERVEEYTD